MFKITITYGLSAIDSYQCALINGCWSKDHGCVYPVDLHDDKSKSSQGGRFSRMNEIVYGRHKCQHFDDSSPRNILKSYHRCLSAGCSVDDSVTDMYYNHLFTIGNELSAKKHWQFWENVLRGFVGAFNIDEEYNKYQSGSLQLARLPSGSNFFKDCGGRPCRPNRPFIYKRSSYCPYKPFFVPGSHLLKGSFEECCDIHLCYLPKSQVDVATLLETAL